MLIYMLEPTHASSCLSTRTNSCAALSETGCISHKTLKIFLKVKKKKHTNTNLRMFEMRSITMHDNKFVFKNVVSDLIDMFSINVVLKN